MAGTRTGASPGDAAGPAERRRVERRAERRTTSGRPQVVSIDDVALAAGVSTATVSRALRGLPGVSDRTRRRVTEAAAALDYAISPIAAGLASGRIRTVAVVTPYVGRWFFGEILMAAADELVREGYEISLYVIDALTPRRQFFSDLPPRGRVGAVLMIGFPVSSSEHRRLQTLGVPLLVAGHVPGGHAAVGIDDVEAARLAVAHLTELGHRDIATIVGDRDHAEQFVVPRQRTQGYREAMLAVGADPDARPAVYGHFTADGGEAATYRLLDERAVPPTAIFCQSDEMAFGAIRALRSRGLAVPQDVSVVGIDDHEHARLWDLTTVAQPVAGQGRRAALLALRGIAGLETVGPETVVRLPVHLEVRGSTGPPRDPERALIGAKG